MSYRFKASIEGKTVKKLLNVVPIASIFAIVLAALMLVPSWAIAFPLDGLYVSEYDQNLELFINNSNESNGRLSVKIKTEVDGVVHILEGNGLFTYIGSYSRNPTTIFFTAQDAAYRTDDRSTVVTQAWSGWTERPYFQQLNVFGSQTVTRRNGSKTVVTLGGPFVKSGY